MRKVKNISGQVRNSGQGRKRKMVMKFARRLLAMKKDEQEQLKVSEWHSQWYVFYLCLSCLTEDKHIMRKI